MPAAGCSQQHIRLAFTFLPSRTLVVDDSLGTTTRMTLATALVSLKNNETPPLIPTDSRPATTLVLTRQRTTPTAKAPAARERHPARRSCATAGLTL